MCLVFPVNAKNDPGGSFCSLPSTVRARVPATTVPEWLAVWWCSGAAKPPANLRKKWLGPLLGSPSTGAICTPVMLGTSLHLMSAAGISTAPAAFLALSAFSGLSPAEARYATADNPTSTTRATPNLFFLMDLSFVSRHATQDLPGE